MAEPYYRDADVTLHLGDCLDVLRAMEAGSVDAVVTDPPYGLEFMGKEWDKPSNLWANRNPEDYARPEFRGQTASPYLSARVNKYVAGPLFQRWCEQWARECLRVLKPGGWLLAFGGTRTWHRLVCGIEDAGFEVRDAVADLTGYDAPGLMWVYGSGFPKSLDVSKAIDKAAGAEREVIATGAPRSSLFKHSGDGRPQDAAQYAASYQATVSATDDAARWEGWGTALKPGWEPVAVGRKPLGGTVASNVVAWGTGALNIDGCRVAGEKVHTTRNTALGVMNDDGWQPQPGVFESHDAGRWPPNVVLGPAAAAELDRQSSGIHGAGSAREAIREADATGMWRLPGDGQRYGDSGGASRFFPVFRYEAKAGASERPRAEDGTAHPTVKPVDLMRWLVRLVTPPGGLVLDPFAGSGTTGEACIVEGFRCVLAEKDPASAGLIVRRLRKPIQPVMFGLDAG